MQRIAKFARHFTVLIFLGVLLFVYAYMPDQVGITANEYDKPDSYISREFFFYAMLIGFMVINLIFVVGSQLLDMVPVKSTSFYVSDVFKMRFVTWVRGLGVMINIFLIILVAFVGLFNNADYYHISQFSMLAYLGQFLIFIWIVLFFYILAKRK